jgi:hypothetical protein
MLIAPSLMSVGEGLLTTLNRDSPTSHWVAFQFISGFGLGFGMQTSGLAIQTVLPREDISTGIAINFFVQQLGGAVFTSVGQSILTNLLVSQLAAVPGFDSRLVVNEGATKLWENAPPEYVDVIVEAYNYACRHIFYAAMGLAFASFLCAFGMEWRSIKKGKNGQGPPGPPGPPGPGPGPGPSPDAPPPRASQSEPDSPDSTTGPVPGRPYFEGIKGSIKSKSQRNSTLGSKSRRDSRKVEKRQSILEGRKQGVLAKLPPDRASQSSSSTGTGLSLPSEIKRDEELAGALNDWATYARAEEENGEGEGEGKKPRS